MKSNEHAINYIDSSVHGGVTFAYKIRKRQQLG